MCVILWSVEACVEEHLGRGFWGCIDHVCGTHTRTPHKNPPPRSTHLSPFQPRKLAPQTQTNSKHTRSRKHHRNLHTQNKRASGVTWVSLNDDNAAPKCLGSIGQALADQPVPDDHNRLLVQREVCTRHEGDPCGERSESEQERLDRERL